MEELVTDTVGWRAEGKGGVKAVGVAPLVNLFRTSIVPCSLAR